MATQTRAAFPLAVPCLRLFAATQEPGRL